MDPIKEILVAGNFLVFPPYAMGTIKTKGGTYMTMTNAVMKFFVSGFFIFKTWVNKNLE